VVEAVMTPEDFTIALECGDPEDTSLECLLGEIVKFALHRGLHGTDQPIGLEKSSIDDWAQIPIYPVDSRELTGSHERQVGVGRDGVEVEAYLARDIF